MSTLDIRSVRKLGNRIARAIITLYKKYRVYFDIESITPNGYGFVFTIKLIAGGGRVEEIKKFASTVQILLGLPVFYVQQEGLRVYIVASNQTAAKVELMGILRDPYFPVATKDMVIPYVLGVDKFNRPVIIDIEKKNLLIGGSPGFGKTESVKSLMISIMWSCSPDDVHIIVFDTGAADLNVFKNMCTVINDPKTSLHAIVALKNEMERRVELETKSADEYKKLKHVVIIHEEFPALVSRLDSDQTKVLSENILPMLQRYRHAKYTNIVVGQNPTKKIMGNLDLASINTRIALNCIKEIYSYTILGDTSACGLDHPGAMVCKIPGYNGFQRIQGSFIDPDVIPIVLEEIHLKHGTDTGFKLTPDDIDLSQPEIEPKGELIFSSVSVPTKGELDDKLLADIIIWALGRDSVPGNQIKKKFCEGSAKKSEKFVERLQQLGIISKPNRTAPGKVLPLTIEDLNESAIDFMVKHGHSKDNVAAAIANRN